MKAISFDLWSLSDEQLEILGGTATVHSPWLTVSLHVSITQSENSSLRLVPFGMRKVLRHKLWWGKMLPSRGQQVAEAERVEKAELLLPWGLLLGTHSWPSKGPVCRACCLVSVSWIS